MTAPAGVAAARAASSGAPAEAAPAVPKPRVAGAARPGHRLALVPPVRAGAPRAPFVILLGSLLVGGLAGLLFLHTALAEDSFRLQDLKNRSAALTAREQALEQEVARDASPRRLAARAEALGMVRSESPAFIRLSDGKVLGKPKPGVAPPPPAPRATPTQGAGQTPTPAPTTSRPTSSPASGQPSAQPGAR